MPLLRTLQGIVGAVANVAVANVAVLGGCVGVRGFVANEYLYNYIPKDAIQARFYEMRTAREESVTEEETRNYQESLTREGIREDIQKADKYTKRVLYHGFVAIGSIPLFLGAAAISGTFSRKLNN